MDGETEAQRIYSGGCSRVHRFSLNDSKKKAKKIKQKEGKKTKGK